jgi:hypothetical protein
MKSVLATRESLTSAASSKGSLSPDLISEGVEYSKGLGVSLAKPGRLSIMRRELYRRKQEETLRGQNLNKPESSGPTKLGADMATVPETEELEYLMTESDPEVSCCVVRCELM